MNTFTSQREIDAHSIDCVVEKELDGGGKAYILGRFDRGRLARYPANERDNITHLPIWQVKRTEERPTADGKTYKTGFPDGLTGYIFPLAETIENDSVAWCYEGTDTRI